MAYLAAVATPVTWSTPADRFTKIVVVETGIVDANDDFEIPVPEAGVVTSHTAALTAGDGAATTIDPRLGEAEDGVDVLDNGAAAASTRSRTDSRYYVAASVLHGGSRANGNTGTTGSVTTTVIIRHGH